MRRVLLAITVSVALGSGALALPVSAEVFTDFLDMADHFLSAGYKDPAAVMGGAASL